MREQLDAAFRSPANQTRITFPDSNETQLQRNTRLFGLQIDGLLDIDRFRQSYAALEKQLETLHPFIGIAALPSIACDFRFAVTDVSATPPDARCTAIHKWARAEAHDLAASHHDLAFRARLLQWGPRTATLLLISTEACSGTWSLEGLMQAWFAFYEMGPQAPLASLQLPVLTEHVGEMMTDVAVTEHARFWQTYLAGAPRLLELATDHPRPATRHYQAASQTVTFSSELGHALERLCHHEGGDLFIGLLAVWQTLLHRYTRQTDIVVGAPGTQQALSHERFINHPRNMLAIRTDLADEPSFRQLVQRVIATTQHTLAHQALPFADVVALLGEEQQNYATVFQTALAFHEAVPTIMQADLQVQPLALTFAMLQPDLALACQWQADGLGATLMYDADLFESATIQRMLAQLEVLTMAATTQPDQSIDTLPLLTAFERHQLLREWNTIQTDFPPAACLHELFARQTAATPDAVALACDGAQVTYGALNHRANQLAHYLRRAGVGPDVCVGLAVERSLDLLVGILGVLKAGGAYVPLDPTYPSERLAFILADTHAPIVLTQAPLLAQLPLSTPSQPDQAPRKVVCLDADWEQIAAESSENPINQNDPQHMAYVIFTSGSTGVPKGVLITHANVTRLFAATNQWFGFGPHDAWPLFHSYAFDVSVWEMWAALLHGGRLIIIPRAVARSSDTFYDLLVREQATMLSQTPSAFRQLIQVEESRGMAKPLALRYIVFAGEALHLPNLRPWLQRHSDQFPKLVNMYGITETTVHVTYRQISAADVQPPALSVIGGAMPDLSMYVLDSHLQPVPIGVPGELFVGGAGLARGYLNRPDLTAERFIANPFSTEPGARLYRSGDLVRYLPSGDMEYLGRIDQQVKVRGFRIELGEIESALNHIAQVHACVVLVREDVPGDQRIVAYVVLSAPISVPALREQLQAKLPSYMVPAAIVILDALPLTTNGKVDRRALPMPDQSALAIDDYVGPRTPLEAQLAAIWADVLQLELVSVTADFFTLGGHSLLATRVLAHVQVAFAIDLPVSELFDAPSVAAFAERIEQARASATSGGPPPIIAMPSPGPQLLSYAQERMWFLDQLQPDSAVYVIALVVKVQRALDMAVLRQSVQLMVQRHASLRTAFLPTPAGPRQIIMPDAQVSFTVVAIRDFAPTEREAAIQHHAQQAARRPFDLETAPLWRIEALEVDEAETILLMTQHHIISDGWSLAVLLQDLLTTYDALLARQTPRLRELPIQYTDYARWQQAWLQEEVLATQLAYWVEELNDVPTLLELPSDHPRPPVQSFRGARQAFDLALPLTQQLRALSQHEGTTLYMTLLAAFEVLLQRYTRQSDFVVGTVVAGRQRPELEHLVGFFVNTLPLHADLTGDPTFQALLARTRALTLAAFAHQDVPFENIVAALHPERDLSYHPLIQAMFVLQNTALGALDAADGSLRVIELENGTSQFDLLLEVTETKDGLQAAFQYSTDLFAAATIARMAGHFTRLLTSISANPHQSIARLPLLSAAELQELVVTRNATRVDYEQLPFVPQAVTDQAERAPQALALADATSRVTYGELNGRANQLAHYLIEIGVGPEIVVGVCLERSIEMIVTLLAIFKAGGAYLPIDPDYPTERRGFMIQDARIPVLVTRVALTADLPLDGIHVIMPDAAAVQAQIATNPAVVITADHLAYVIYTSGSTGQPKGVQITHNNLRNLNAYYQQAFHVTAQDRCTQMAGPGFDATIMEIWPCLTSGASLFITDEETRLSPETLRDWLVARNITISMIPTVMAEQLVMLDWPASTALRWALTGGEALQMYPTPRFPATFVNNYGPTEATVMVSSGQVPTETHSDGPPSIGWAIANTQLYLLDEQLQLVPAGVAGELYIGGAQVARGYLGRPDLTFERFIPHPFSDVPGARLYKTGDLCRYRPNGALAYIGRTDQQIKIRGFRIELGEIESALREHADISQALVLVREDTPGDKRLIAYVIPKAATRVTVADARAFLQARLPSYMIPTAIIELETLPLTPNGKVDRRALPSADATVVSSNDYVAPRTTLEAEMAAIWADVLRLEQVSVTANFFTLGGHSLLATRLASRIRSVLSLEMPLRALFTAPTIAELAQTLTTSPQTALTPIPRSSRNQPLPLSSGQERIWFFDQLDPDSTLYLMPSAARVKRLLDVPLLTASLQAVVARHESLRTIFQTTATGPVQVILPATHINIPIYVVDLQQRSPDEQAADIQEHALREAQTPFRLDQAPLLRVTILVLGAADLLIIITQHHISADGWSVEVLLRDWLNRYDALCGERAAKLTDLAIQYADFAIWQRAWLQSDACASQLAFWQAALAEMPTLLELPTDYPRPNAQTYRGDSHAVMLAPVMVSDLQAVSQHAGVTLYTTVLAAFAILLQRYSRQDTFLLGTTMAGRGRAELEDLIGFFVNTVALPVRLDDDPRFTTLLTRMQSIILAAQERQDVPFDLVVEALHPTRDASRQPIVQVMFTFQEAWQATRGVQVEPLVWQLQSAKFDLTLGVTQTASGLQLVFEYRTDLFAAATITRMAEHFTHLLASIAAHPDQPISTFTLLTDDDYQHIVVDWNATKTNYPREATIATIFQNCVAASPDAIAVVCGDDQLTYHELNRRANQLAHYLRSRGIGLDIPVGLCLERSLELIISLVAILKAGGYYVPIDPTYPAERLMFMLADARVGLLITHRQLSLPELPTALTVLDLDEMRPLLADLSTSDLPMTVGPQHLAYVNYTSGSTGMPKGVSIPHQAVLRLVKETNFARLTAAEVFLQLATITFDAATLEIWGPLLNGGRLVILPPGTPTLEELGQALRRYHITTLWLTAGLFHQMVEDQLTSFTGVRQLLAGGDVLSVPHVRKVLETFPDTTVINGYGPTEGTTFTTCYPMTTVSQVGKSVAIGRPIANTQVYVLDAQQQPVAVDIPGELYIGGDGLARGYLQRPELTAERFVPHPLSTTPGARLYRTGDLVRYLSDGNIEFLGRLDQQVKVRGYRIELGEIESALSLHPHVRACVVIAREDVPGDKRLVAYVVADALVVVSVLRDYLHARLPAYMVPTAFVMLAALPLNASGKVERRALPPPDEEVAGGAEFVAPRTPLEAQLATMWADVLHLDQVSITADFFMLGGHSLLATRLISQIRTSLQQSLSLRVVFEQSTIAAMAAYIEHQNGHLAATGAIQPTARGEHDLNDLLGMVEQLADEDILALLAGETDSE